MRNNTQRLAKAIRSLYDNYVEKNGCLAPEYKQAACSCTNALQMWRGPKGEKGEKGDKGDKGDNAGSFLVSAEFVKNPSGMPAGSYLKLVLIDVAQQEQVVYVDLSELTDIYTAGDGVSITDMVVAARLGAGLRFDEDGNIESAYQFCRGLADDGNTVEVSIDENDHILGFSQVDCAGLKATVDLTESAEGTALVLTGRDGAVLGTVPLVSSDGIEVRKLASGGFTWIVDAAGLISAENGNSLVESGLDGKLYSRELGLSYTYGEGRLSLIDRSGTEVYSVIVPTMVQSLESAELVCDSEQASSVAIRFTSSLTEGGQVINVPLDDAVSVATGVPASETVTISAGRETYTGSVPFVVQLPNGVTVYVPETGGINFYGPKASAPRKLELRGIDPSWTDESVTFTYDDDRFTRAPEWLDESREYHADPEQVPYSFRASGGSLSIGTRETDDLVGGTLNWNQLVRNGNFEDRTTGWTGTRGSISATNGVLSYTVTTAGNSRAGNRIASAVYPATIGHRLLVSADVNISQVSKEYYSIDIFSAASTSTSGMSAALVNKRVYPSDGWVNISGISTVLDATAAGVISTKILFPYAIAADVIQVRNCMSIDLTALFGTEIADYIYSLEQANAGAGVAFFRKLFPKDYYAYNAGELMSVQAASHDMVGFNQWDEEWEKGTINAITGVPGSNDVRFRSNNFIPILPDREYYFHNPEGTTVLYFYDAEYNFLGTPSASRSNQTYLPATAYPNAAYMKFVCNNGTGTYAGGTICINFSHSGYRNGEYEPYVKRSYPLDSSLTLRGVWKLDASNNLYCDGDTYASDGTVERRYGIVDLGTLTWNTARNGSNYWFYTDNLASLVKPTASSSLGSILCSLYSAATYNNVVSHAQDKIISVGSSGGGSNNNVQIYDSSKASMTADEFKASLSGVMLVYELATPTTETAEPFQNPQIVDDFGTEQYVDAGDRDVAIPVGHSTYYIDPAGAVHVEAADSPVNPQAYQTLASTPFAQSNSPLSLSYADGAVIADVAEADMSVWPSEFARADLALTFLKDDGTRFLQNVPLDCMTEFFKSVSSPEMNFDFHCDYEPVQKEFAVGVNIFDGDGSTLAAPVKLAFSLSPDGTQTKAFKIRFGADGFGGLSMIYPYSTVAPRTIEDRTNEYFMDYGLPKTMGIDGTHLIATFSDGLTVDAWTQEDPEHPGTSSYGIVYAKAYGPKAEAPRQFTLDVDGTVTTHVVSMTDGSTYDESISGSVVKMYPGPTDKTKPVLSYSSSDLLTAETLSASAYQSPYLPFSATFADGQLTLSIPEKNISDWPSELANTYMSVTTIRDGVATTENASMNCLTNYVSTELARVDDTVTELQESIAEIGGEVNTALQSVEGSFSCSSEDTWFLHSCFYGEDEGDEYIGFKTPPQQVSSFSETGDTNLSMNCTLTYSWVTGKPQSALYREVIFSNVPIYWDDSCYHRGTSPRGVTFIAEGYEDTPVENIEYYALEIRHEEFPALAEGEVLQLIPSHVAKVTVTGFGETTYDCSNVSRLINSTSTTLSESPINIFVAGVASGNILPVHITKNPAFDWSQYEKPTLTLTSTQTNGASVTQTIDMSCLADMMDDKIEAAVPDLSSYALDANVVHKTGNETIGGIKTFTNSPTISTTGNAILSLQHGTGNYDDIRFVDATGTNVAVIRKTVNNGDLQIGIKLQDGASWLTGARINISSSGSCQVISTNGTNSYMLQCTNTGQLTFSGPEPDVSDDSTKLATTEWVHDAINSDALIKAIDAYYAVRRTGKVYQTKFPLYSTATTTAGEKLLDNANLVCVPSTDTVEGQDDYADIPMFQWVNVNYIREADGSPVPTAIEGQANYATSGSVDVGVMQMSFWWKWEEKDGYIYVTVSDLPHEELGLIPWRECVKADGTVLPYCIGSKYMAGDASDGNKRSQPGINIWNRTCSYQTCITEFQKKGAGYWGAGMEADTFQIIMFAIKYANKNMQSIMMGCTDYNVYGYVALAETEATRILLPANTATFAEGSYIQAGSSTVANRDRSSADAYDVCDHAKVLSVEDVEVDGTTYTALNIDKTVTTVLGGVVASTPFNAGATDAVLGRHDGSPVSNSDGDHPYRIQGREYAVGAWTVACNIASYKTDGGSKMYYAAKSVAHSITASVITGTYTDIGDAYVGDKANFWVGDIAVDDDHGAWWPLSKGPSNSTGWCDYAYVTEIGGYQSNVWREFLWGGHLYNGLNVGPCSWAGNRSLGYAAWGVAARD